MSVKNQLNDYFQARTASEEFSGVVRISRGEMLLFSGAYGFSSRAWRVRCSLDTRFDTASITKLFTAVAILQQIQDGKLSFETRAVEYLDLKDTSISSEANLYHLLTHSSGIGDDADEEAGEIYEDLWRTKPNYLVTTTADFLPQFIHKPANFAPGQGCRYCNVGYILLGLALEKATGRSYRELVQERVFKAAGMQRSGFFRMDRAEPDVAEGCDPLRGEDGRITGWKRNIYSYPPIGSPDGGAHVTAADLERFLHRLHDGTLLSPEMSRLFFTPQVFYGHMGGWDKYYGYGPWFYLEPGGQLLFWQKEGINAGVSGMLRYYPRHEISVVVLSNMEEGAWEPIWEIHDRLISGELAELP